LVSKALSMNPIIEAMKPRLSCILAMVVIAAVVVGCSPDSKSPIVQTAGDSEMHKQQDGLSFETAVVLEAQSQAEGVAAQHAWIEKHLPGARPAPPPKTDAGDEIVTFGQEVVQHGGKLYSVVYLVMPEGKLRNVHFDITGYFGK
jgi:hypothetical protein